MKESAPKKNSHCSFCGQRFDEALPWPRTCSNCGQTTFLNPLPVAVMLLPVEDGLLAIRRAIPPHQGMLALPGGYINLGESWQQAGAREVLEESGIALDPGGIRLFNVLSAPDGTLLVFGIAADWLVTRRSLADLPTFQSDAETSERVIIHNAQQLAFALHAQAAADFFGRENEENDDV